MSVATKHKLASFGMFEVDLDAGEIRKSGFRVRLPGQPFRLLTALIARPGEILSREELQHEIWGSNTNVDFERGLASAVNKLREALGDSADHPRYIETLARKGYRFIAPVTLTAGPEASEAALTGVTATSTIMISADPEISAEAAATSAQVHADPSTTPFDPPVEAAKGSQAVLEPRTRAAVLSTGRHTLLLLGTAAALILLTVWFTLRWTQFRGIMAPPHIEQITQTNNIFPGPPNAETFLSIATDGPRLYVPVLVDGRSQISSLALNGTETEPIRMPEDLQSGAISGISADGSKLLVRSGLTRESEQPLWIVPTTGSGVLRVGEVLAHDATWMPGSRETVLFASGNDLGLVQLGTGAVSTYASLPGRAFWLRWSPDGKTLRFTLLDPVTHSSSLWELDAGTRRASPLSLPRLKNLNLCCGSWTASGDQYVFQASDESYSNLWVVGTGHAEPVQLTNGPIRFTSPLPSLEGRSVFAFGVAQPGGTRLYNHTLQQFVAAPRFLENAQRLNYSRDGSWVAWTDPNERLWRAKSKDGADLLRLTGNDLEVFSAHWSPDGQQLLLMARQPGETWQIYTVNATGGAVHRVLEDARNLADPDWSPDGNQIVFGREADLMGKDNGPRNIQVLDLRTHQVKPIPESVDLFSPRWSPDGQWIAALSRDQSKLLVYNLQDRLWKTLFTGSAADPVWSADSRSVYFHAFAQANSAILRAGVDGAMTTVADLSRMGLTPADNYFFSGVTPDGSPLIEPRVGTGNLYSIELPAR